MGIRDKELERLIKYAEGTGLKVKMNNTESDQGCGGWATDGTELILYLKTHRSKIEQILTMIHEISHHVWFIHKKNREPDLKFEEALERQNLYEVDEAVTPAPKHMRKKILDVEIAGSRWWETIYKETDMKFPIYKMHLQMEFDLWIYEEYYETGHFPSSKDRKAKWKEIRKKKPQ